MQNCDAALVVGMADTQYVLLREKSAFSMRDGVRRCLATRYVMNGKPSDWSSRGGEFRLGGPEQPVTLTRGAGNALTMVVDSIVIAIDDIVVADSAITFRIGVEEADRPAALYFYGKEGRPEDPFGETTIQQMIGLALALDGIMSEWDADIDTGFAEADAALEEASLALEAAEREMEGPLMPSGPSTAMPSIRAWTVLPARWASRRRRLSPMATTISSMWPVAARAAPRRAGSAWKA